MALSPEQMLSLGLQKGFGGDTNMSEGQRGGFKVKVSHYEDPESGGVYHDEWLPGRLGGGQELVRVGEKLMTRLYGGGTLDSEKLEELKITEEDVMGFLIDQIRILGNSTRLHESCGPVMDGDWQYEYAVQEQLPEFSLTSAKESISYKGEVVFVHLFLLAEVR